MIDREKALQKVLKCLRLAKSANEHEAAAALRQAQKLMAEYGITDADLLAAEAGEARSPSRATEQPVSWEVRLCNLVADAFGCMAIFSHGSRLWERRAEWVFVGCGASPEIASFAFEVLLRQARKARTEHIAKHLRRCGPSSKTRRGDLFSAGWVAGVADKVERFARNERVEGAIEAYVAAKFGQTTSTKVAARYANRSLTHREAGDWSAGHSRGTEAQLQHGVGARTQHAIGG